MRRWNLSNPDTYRDKAPRVAEPDGREEPGEGLISKMAEQKKVEAEGRKDRYKRVAFQQQQAIRESAFEQLSKKTADLILKKAESEINAAQETLELRAMKAKSLINRGAEMEREFAALDPRLGIGLDASFSLERNISAIEHTDSGLGDAFDNTNLEPLREISRGPSSQPGTEKKEIRSRSAAPAGRPNDGLPEIRTKWTEERDRLQYVIACLNVLNHTSSPIENVL